MNGPEWLKAAVLALSPIVEERTGHDVSDVPIHWYADEHPRGEVYCGFTDYRGVHLHPCLADKANGIDPSVSRLGVLVQQLATVIARRELQAVMDKLDLTRFWAGWIDLQSKVGRKHPRLAPAWVEPILDRLGPWNITN